MGSYEGSSDWDALPSRESFEAFKPRPAPGRAQPRGPASDRAQARGQTPELPAEADDTVSAEARARRPRLNALFAFDTTGSMTPWVENVQQKMEYLGDGLSKLLDMEIALIGVGDHGDGRNMLQIKPFSRELPQLKKDIADLRPTDGQDAPEALECLFKVVNAMDLAAPTVMVLITDSVPHGMDDYPGEDDGCPFGVDWKEEMDELRGRLKNVYLVSCATDPKVLALQKTIVPANSFIQLSDFRRLTNLVMAVCMSEVGELDYFLDILEKQRGRDRRDEVVTLMGRS